MTMKTYIGFNFPMKLSEEEMEDELDLYLPTEEDEYFSIVKEKHFSTPYIYEFYEHGKPYLANNRL